MVGRENLVCLSEWVCYVLTRRIGCVCGLVRVLTKRGVCLKREEYERSMTSNISLRTKQTSNTLHRLSPGSNVGVTHLAKRLRCWNDGSLTIMSCGCIDLCQCLYNTKVGKST